MESTGQHSVIDAINTLGGVYMFGRYLPIWALVLIDFPFAFFTQLFFIQPFIRTVFKFLFRKDIKNRQEH